MSEPVSLHDALEQLRQHNERQRAALNAMFARWDDEDRRRLAATELSLVAASAPVEVIGEGPTSFVEVEQPKLRRWQR